jgi:hypothetical protein
MSMEKPQEHGVGSWGMELSGMSMVCLWRHAPVKGEKRKDKSRVRRGRGRGGSVQMSKRMLRVVQGNGKAQISTSLQ